MLGFDLASEISFYFEKISCLGFHFLLLISFPMKR